MNLKARFEWCALLVFSIILCRSFSFIPFAGVSHDMMRSLASNDGVIAKIMSVMSGGAYSRYGIAASGMGPYVFSSLIVSFLQSSNMLGMKKSEMRSSSGVRMRDLWVKIFTIFFAIAQTIILLKSDLLRRHANEILIDNNAFLFTAAVASIGSSMSFIWIAKKLSILRIGNGVSLIILMNIVSGIPSHLSHLYDVLSDGVVSYFVILLGIALVIMTSYIIIFVELSYRAVRVNYPKHFGLSGARNDIIPMKLNISGIVPFICANVMLVFMLRFFGMFDFNVLVFLHDVLMQNRLVHTLMIVMFMSTFVFIYSDIAFDSVSIAKDIGNSGAFIEGCRPGKATEIFLKKIVSKLCIVASIYLALLLFIADFTTYISSGIIDCGISAYIVITILLDMYSNIVSEYRARVSMNA